jgi:hypothetical protein
VGTDLVEQDGGVVAQEDVAVKGEGEVGIVELEGIEFALCCWFVWMCGAEFGSITIGCYCEGAEEL